MRIDDKKVFQLALLYPSYTSILHETLKVSWAIKVSGPKAAGDGGVKSDALPPKFPFTIATTTASCPLAF
jgi:hypothetical protein